MKKISKLCKSAYSLDSCTELELIDSFLNCEKFTLTYDENNRINDIC